MPPGRSGEGSVDGGMAPVDEKVGKPWVIGRYLGSSLTWPGTHWPVACSSPDLTFDGVS